VNDFALDGLSAETVDKSGNECTSGRSERNIGQVYTERLSSLPSLGSVRLLLSQRWFSHKLCCISSWHYAALRLMTVLLLCSRAHGALNFFGGQSIPTDRQEMVMEFEVSNDDAMFVILSDVWLDTPVTMRKLRKLFEGFDGMGSSIVFVFMGNFLSESHGASAHLVLTESMNTLANLINEFEDIRANACFLFVPGPRDVGGSSVLPR
jgi:hypothetical protein